eukprot:4933695-Lingulodinium_polyedra.AAC.1
MGNFNTTPEPSRVVLKFPMTRDGVSPRERSHAPALVASLALSATALAPSARAYRWTMWRARRCPAWAT